MPGSDACIISALVSRLWREGWSLSWYDSAPKDACRKAVRRWHREGGR